MKFDLITAHIKSPIANINVNSLVVSSSGKAIIFDPCAPLQELIEATMGKKVVAIILTHGHWDHILTLHEALTMFNCPCYLHPLATQKLNDSTLNCSTMHNLDFKVGDLTDFEFIEFNNTNGNLKIEEFNIDYFNTPGHSDCSVSFIMEGNLLCGDTLRLHKLARTDLPTSNLNDLNNSISLYKKLPQNSLVYSGHEGVDTLQNYLKNAVIKL
jgi:hydroxyacylglutathione hydrolase